MVVTDEPAYYKEGAFGIRLENVLLVKKAAIKGESEMLCFEPLTLVPFAKELIDFSALTPNEKKWLAAYHKRVYETLAPHLSPALKKWLKAKTEAA
jgi:Xaa-Pro aminopeptidase